MATDEQQFEFQSVFEQHPVPQQISSYQFRLVGDMTIKQFFQLAGGALVGVLIYATPLPNIFKWPLIVSATLAGAAFAFLPVQERPLEEWIFAFFRSVYSPTIYKWKRFAKPRQFFLETDLQKTQVTAPTAIPTDTSQVPEEKPALLPTAPEESLEEAEKTYLSKIKGLLRFSPKPKPPEPVQEKPRITVEEIIKTEPTTSTVNASIADVASKVTVRPEVVTPKTSPVTVAEKKGFTPPPPQAPPVRQTPIRTSFSQSYQPIAKSVAAQFSDEAAPPAPPTQPNVVVGQVKTSSGELIESAILEIKDSQGHSIRALKTNKAGHFLSVTPLANGEYKLITEKEGFEFEPVSFQAKGQVIPPISIRAKNLVKTP